MLLCERLQLSHELGVTPGVELCFDPVLGDHEAELLQPRDLGLSERLEAEVGQWRAAPERECLPKLFRARIRRLPPRLVDQTPESLEVELLRLEAQLVAGR